MNVVGKVGSLISQGVYSVATPFHPFGGAVDVIVVQQQDGTFRSTPWYVRFGKFQGVLKGAEKIVRISVNGVEANFHMYLDNSGEAFFLREAGSSKEGETKDSDYIDDTEDDCSVDVDSKNECNGNNVGVHRLEHSVSDSVMVRLREECNSSCKHQIERADSEGDRRLYEIQNEQTPLDKQYDVESQASDSEVILVSVDGHVLTAPISGLEEDTGNVQLCTPQFHLGPGEGPDFCEGNEELCSDDDEWAADFLSKLNASTADDDMNSVCSNGKGGSNTFGSEVEVCEETTVEGEQVHQVQETESVVNQEVAEVFKSCVDLPALVTQGQNTPNVAKQVHQAQETKSVANQNGDLLTQRSTEDVAEVFKSCVDLPALGTEVQNMPNMQAKTNDGSVTEFGNNGALSPSSGCNTLGDNALPELCDGVEPIRETSMQTEHANSDREGTNSELVDSQAANSDEGVQSNSSIKFEISLCGSELRPGMGSVAAAAAFDAHLVSGEEFRNSAESITKNENLIVRFGERYLPWQKAAPVVLGMAAFGLELPVEDQDVIPVEDDETTKAKDNDSEINPSSSRRWRLWPIPFRRVKTIEHTTSNASIEDVFVDSESDVRNEQGEQFPASPGGHESPHKHLLRTNVPTNEQIASLNLKEGQNMITFSFSTRVLGTQQVHAHIYLWKWNARIVISDVDGTITRSDVLGQFMPLLGKDWTQSGVARLFSAIKENGYQLLFLSARAIVQAYLTRTYLLNLKQDGKALPNGPVVISPDGLFPSLYREVIRRAPHEFKIACLEDIRKLFPSDYNPFYAGFGNRDTDELSYRKIGIPKGKIFIINPKGEVAISRHRIDVKSYTSLHTLVNDMFPPTSLVEQEDFNNWNYWRMPIQEVDI